MIKIGIITILKVNNYGAELQAYAMQAYLRKAGYDAEIIDYLFYKNKGHKATKGSRPIFHFPLSAKIKERLYPLIMSIKGICNKEADKARKANFAKFHEDNTAMSPTYHSVKELYAAKLPYDIYMTGSDQVWNPGIYSSIAPYFLTFAPKGKKRIAYAASFGVAKIPEYAKDYYRQRLDKYDAIGVREKNAVDIVRQLSSTRAEWVLDPTLLLGKEEWMKVAKPTNEDISGKYILIYELTPCQYIRRLADHLHQATGWQIVRICKGANREDKELKIINVTDAGPAEFLYLFANASAVVTNSFHGTAFSINFQRDFYTVTPARKQNNSRQKSILELFGLTDRLLPEDAQMPQTDKLHIDYAPVREILQRERGKSAKFLNDAINGQENTGIMQ